MAGTITAALFYPPHVPRGMDEVLKMVPFELKETSYALGATRLETAVKSRPETGIAEDSHGGSRCLRRGISDAASVLFTASFTDSLPSSPFQACDNCFPLAIFFQLAHPSPRSRRVVTPPSILF